MATVPVQSFGLLLVISGACNLTEALKDFARRGRFTVPAELHPSGFGTTVAHDLRAPVRSGHLDAAVGSLGSSALAQKLRHLIVLRGMANPRDHSTKAEPSRRIPEVVSPNTSNGKRDLIDRLGKLLALVATGFVLLAGLVTAGVKVFVAGDIASIKAILTDDASFRADDRKRMEKIETDVADVRKAVNDELIKLLERAYPSGGVGASAPKPRATLRSTKELLELASAAKVALKPDLVRRIGASLATSAGDEVMSPVYWQATSEFINFRSMSENGSARHLPKCKSTTPTRSPNFLAKGRAQTDQAGRMRLLGLGDYWGAGYTYRDCEVDLDDDNLIRDQTSVGLSFETIYYVRCLVHLVTGKRAPTGMHFVDCTFSFKLLALPPAKNVQALTEQLLTAEKIKELSLSPLSPGS